VPDLHRQRVAVLSDIHGNLAALDAVIADLEVTSPDLIVQAGDVAVIGPRPAEVVDRLRRTSWPGVVGNTDELLWNRAVRADQEQRAPKLKPWLQTLFDVLAPWAFERLGQERLDWLRAQPREWRSDNMLVMHAGPGDLWRAPMADATDAELQTTYGGRGAQVVVYGHIHRPFVRNLPDLYVANSGSVGLPYDGDRRASYLLIDDGLPHVRRVEYDMDRQRQDLEETGFPLGDWLHRVQETAQFSAPEARAGSKQEG
jgi:putative phosphoesterase